MINQLLEDYERLRASEAARDLPRLEKAILLVTHSVFAAEGDVEAEVSQLNAWPGWLRRQSGIWRTPPEKAGAAQTAGLPLSGEWCNPDTESRHLRQDGKGGWLLYHYREFPTEADARRALKEAGGTGQVYACLRERSSVLAENQDDNLAYCIYWGGEDGNIRRLFARFAGFKPGAQEEEHRS